ncbi:hypothetical protein [Streptomyces sp. NBC_01233]|uniref:hypothetical protein n=1 Tax=Streptomyces sp. NBC_01233 TaxID=2903787 RepID=UPI002E13A12C|nr:hypothetical protein OG332_11020 [Streptomyces sp. NBC_01233]
MNDSLNRYAFLDRKRNKEQNRAEAWKRDEAMERIASIRSSNPDLYDRMGPMVHMSLGHYENDKKIAAQYGRDVNKGGK